MYGNNNKRPRYTIYVIVVFKTPPMMNFDRVKSPDFFNHGFRSLIQFLRDAPQILSYYAKHNDN